MERKGKIAWAITGAGHLLEESIEAISNLLEFIDIDVFLSRAAEEVIKQYQFDHTFAELKENYSDHLKIIRESQQNPSFPASTKLGLGKYQAFVISPMTGNTVAKCIHCIADTLITNCFMQALKSRLPIYCIPTDFKEGEILTKVPSGEKIPFTIDRYSAENSRKLGTMVGVQIYEKPEILELKKIFNI
mgnify:CR=1 FL=1